jgi:hypothetical protein
VIISAGSFKFKEANVAFHLIRDNTYSPWKTIGVFVVWHNFARSRYIHGYKHLQKEFDREVKLAGPAAFNYDFLDQWHKRHQNSLDVVSKVIRYCTTSDMSRLTDKIHTRYCGSPSLKRMGMMAIMLRSQPRYFPVRFDRNGPINQRQIKALKEEGMI